MNASAFGVTSRVKGLALAPSPHWPADPPNLYVIQGRDAWAMVDSGWGRPEDHEAIDAWLADVRPAGRPTALLITHAHHDHIGGARRLAAVYHLERIALAPEGATARRHALDADFAAAAPDTRLDLGEVALHLLATPGHTAGSMSVHLDDRVDSEDGADVLFTGDTVVGRHSAWVGPPDGDLDVYLDTLARLGDPAAAWATARLAPGHGPAGAPAGAAAENLRRRRLGRDGDILSLLAAGPLPARALSRGLYGEGDGPVLGPGGVAERTVAAHLEHLRRLGRVEAVDGAPAGPDTPFRRLV